MTAVARRKRPTAIARQELGIGEQELSPFTHDPSARQIPRRHRRT